MTALLEIKDLVKEYKDVKAVKGISFSVEQGICFGLIGFICWWASGTTGVSSILSICYWIAGLTAGTYLLYPPAVRNDKKGA